ncbi:MAG TPA: tetratricopeptide repeat protein [Methylomirabilota bacterium]|nr:tetratricopeptide repeat protein [Methylomirabilota bacterium]
MTGAARSVAVLLALTAWTAGATADAASVGRFPGENAVVRGLYFEGHGDLASAEAIYRDVVSKAPSQRAVNAALDRLADLASRAGRTDAQMAYLEAAASNGRPERLSALARLSLDTGHTPPSFRAMAEIWEQTTIATPSASMAMFMAARAEAGDLSGTRAVRQEASYWYHVAHLRGSMSAVPKLLEFAVAEGRIDEAASLLAGLDDARRSREAVSLARAFARGTDGSASDRETAAAVLSLLPAGEASAQAAKLVREAVAAGAVADALFWLDRAGGGDADFGTNLAQLYEKAQDDRVRGRILMLLEARASVGDGASAAAAARIRMANGGRPTPELVRLLLTAATVQASRAGDDLARLVAPLSADEEPTRALLAVIAEAAEAGHVRAMALLGRLYAVGGPVPIDQDASADWVRRAAEAGDAEAQYRVGVALAWAEPPDPETARDWLTRAADQDFGPARSALAALSPGPPP